MADEHTEDNYRDHGYTFRSIIRGGVHYPVFSEDEYESDAFGRHRVSEPETIFDSKQIFDNQPLFWDDSEESGGSTTSTHSAAAARTRIGVALNTAGKRTRQTFRRFNYQPGKSQLILMTGVLTSGAASGVKSSMGLFDDDNGIFLTQDGTTVKLVTRSGVTGSPVDTEVSQADWNLDAMDGNGRSKITLDFTKTQIFLIDFEWLGVGSVRCGFVVDGVIYYVHQFRHANILGVVYMSTPNLPLRYQIENDGTGAATTMDHICTSVMSEGGVNDNGVLRYTSNGTTFINANTAGTWYVLLGIRLKAAALDATVKIITISTLGASNADYEWALLLNPTLDAAVTFGDQTNSVVQTAVGNAGNPSTSSVASGGVYLCGGLASGRAAQGSEIENALLLGAQIDGTRDELYLVANPFAANMDVYGGWTWREIQ